MRPKGRRALHPLALHTTRISSHTTSAHQRLTHAASLAQATPPAPRKGWAQTPEPVPHTILALVALQMTLERNAQAVRDLHAYVNAYCAQASPTP